MCETTPPKRFQDTHAFDHTFLKKVGYGHKNLNLVRLQNVRTAVAENMGIEPSKKTVGCPHLGTPGFCIGHFL